MINGSIMDGHNIYTEVVVFVYDLVNNLLFIDFTVNIKVTPISHTVTQSFNYQPHWCWNKILEGNNVRVDLVVIWVIVTEIWVFFLDI